MLAADNRLIKHNEKTHEQWDYGYNRTLVIATDISGNQTYSGSGSGGGTASGSRDLTDYWQHIGHYSDSSGTWSHNESDGDPTTTEGYNFGSNWSGTYTSLSGLVGPFNTDGSTASGDGNTTVHTQNSGSSGPPVSYTDLYPAGYDVDYAGPGFWVGFPNIYIDNPKSPPSLSFDRAQATTGYTGTPRTDLMTGVWVQSGSGLHQMVGVGDLEGQATYYSFGMDADGWCAQALQAFNPWSQGVVYQDFPPPGSEIDEFVPLTPAQAAEFNRYLASWVGQRSVYGLVFNNCREFSSLMANSARERFGPPPRPQPPNPYEWVRYWFP